jgi:hypothetical protein
MVDDVEDPSDYGPLSHPNTVSFAQLTRHEIDRNLSPIESIQHLVEPLTLSLAQRLDELPPSLARIFVLKTFGSVDCDSIAKRDNRSVADVERDWKYIEDSLSLDARDVTGRGEVGRLVTFDLIDSNLLLSLSREPQLLKALDWRSFEKVMASLLQRLGFEIELQQGTKDGGIDILAIVRSGPFGPHRYLVQAKRWAASVGVEPVRELLFLHQHYKASKSCLATTSQFTRGAWQLADDYRWWLELKDYERLQEWISDAVGRATR